MKKRYIKPYEHTILLKHYIFIRRWIIEHCEKRVMEKKLNSQKKLSFEKISSMNRTQVLKVIFDYKDKV